MTHDAAPSDWLTIPDLAEMLDVKLSRVRRLIEDRDLLAVRRDGVLVVPADFLRDGEPLKELRGTFILLSDAGFNDDEILAWLTEADDSIGDTPLNALRAGRKSEVRRVAQALA
ncbi:Rv2175c family DNA-binding protein [Paramicrobacterium chengjingii]|uniref:Rv2175c family DNA-binding protein n=1 Tax=Paramicrobacterium chengjingii TaxID=2769067 RepID=UPI003D9C68DC